MSLYSQKETNISHDSWVTFRQLDSNLDQLFNANNTCVLLQRCFLGHHRVYQQLHNNNNNSNAHFLWTLGRPWPRPWVHTDHQAGGQVVCPPLPAVQVPRHTCPTWSLRWLWSAVWLRLSINQSLQRHSKWGPGALFTSGRRLFHMLSVSGELSVIREYLSILWLGVTRRLSECNPPGSSVSSPGRWISVLNNAHQDAC